jgi:glycosyltransferase involved in cell wall biosynthesis
MPSTILLVVDGLPIGGTERQIVELLKGLKKNGNYKTALVVLDHGGAFQQDAVSLADGFMPIWRRSRFDITPLLFLTYQAKVISASLIHTFGWMSGFAGLVAARWLRLPIINSGIRTAWTHLPLREKLHKWAMLRADVVVSNSQAGLRAYNLRNHTSARVIYNGLDMTRFDRVIPEHYDRPTICMVANFSKYKDQKTVVRSLPLIQNQIRDIQLILVGKDMGCLDTTRQLVHELDLESCVCFITNTVYPQPIISGSHAGVMMTNIHFTGEGTSNAVLEYMVLGKPVVATNSGGIPEIVRDNETGYLVPAEAPEKLAERVIALLSDPDKAHRMGQAGRLRIEREFSLSRMVSEYEALYQILLAKVDPCP